MEILVADGGSTHCKWGLITHHGTSFIITDGINPYFLPKESIISTIQHQLIPNLSSNNISKIYFYGAGMGASTNRQSIYSALLQLLPKANISVETDMLAAARSLCQKKAGIVCILGTGSNSCLFNGSSIIKQGHSLGYLLGDEGSGSYLGKLVIRNYLYKTFDNHLCEAFKSRFGASKEEILHNVYQKPLANRYIASFAPFLSENRGHSQIEKLVYKALNDFFEVLIPYFTDHLDLPVHFCGSVAYTFQDVIEKICRQNGLLLGKVEKNPLEGLISFHSSLQMPNTTSS